MESFFTKICPFSNIEGPVPGFLYDALHVKIREVLLTKFKNVINYAPMS